MRCPPQTRTLSPKQLQDEYDQAGNCAGDPPPGFGLILHGGLWLNENIRRWVHTCPACGWPVGEFVLSPRQCNAQYPSTIVNGESYTCDAIISEWDPYIPDPDEIRRAQLDMLSFDDYTKPSPTLFREVDSNG